MSTRQPSRVVFVGNIPYGLTEEQIIEIFSGAGRVVNFRLVHDKETGRPKGFGFAEFPDYDSASSAVRNLNDYEIMGRKLRVDFSNETVSDEDNRERHGANANTAGYAPPANGNAAAVGSSSAGVSSLPPLPAGKDLPPGVSCTDAISRTLNTLPPAQLLDILREMKTLATTDPQRATELLTQAPQLNYAIFQALLIMGLVSPEAISSVIEPGAAPPPPLPVAPPSAAAPGAYPAYPPAVPATGTPPVVVAGYAPPAAAPAPAPAPAAGGQDHEALMRVVMELPLETLNQLPEKERQEILALRAMQTGQLH